ncbi:hypothetical protein ACFL42_03145 [Candidatus Omnitrophota bacterium]
MVKLRGYPALLIFCSVAFLIVASSKVGAEKDTPLSEYQTANLIMGSAQASAEANKYHSALKKYAEAMDRLTRIKEQYPTSDVAILVNLKLEECQRSVAVLNERVREAELMERFEGEKASLAADAEKYKKQIELLKGTLENEKKLNEVMRQETSGQIYVLNQRIEELKKLNTGLETKSSQDEQKIIGLVSQAEDIKAESSRELARANAGAEKDIARIRALAEEEITSVRAQAGEQINSREKEFQFALEKESQASALKIGSLTEQNNELRQELAAVRQSSGEALKAQSAKLTAAFNDESGSLKISFEKEKAYFVNELENKKAALEEERLARIRKIEELTTQMKELQDTYKEQIVLIKARAEGEKRSALEALDAEKADLVSSLGKERAALKEALKKEKASAKSAFESEKASLISVFDEERSSLKSALESEKASMKSALESEKASMRFAFSKEKSSLEENIGQLAAENRAYADKTEFMKSQMRALAEDQGKRSKILNAEMQAVKRRNLDLEKGKALDRQKIAALTAAVEDEKARAKDALESKSREFQFALEKEKQASGLKIESLNAKIDHLESSVKNSVKEMARISQAAKEGLSEERKKTASAFSEKMRSLEDGYIEERNSLVLELERLKDTLSTERKAQEAKIKSYADQMKDLADRYKTEMGQVESSAGEAIKRQRQDLVKERKRAGAMEEQLAALRLKLNELEEEKGIYVSQLQEANAFTEDLNAQFNGLSRQSSQLSERAIDDGQEIASLRARVEDLRMRNAELEDSSRGLAQTLEAERERYADNSAKEKALMSKQLGRSKAQLKIARDSLNTYLRKTSASGAEAGSYGSGSNSADYADYEEYQYEAAQAHPAPEAAPALDIETAALDSSPLPKGSFSSVGTISNIFTMDDVGRVYVELSPENIGIVTVGRKLYIVDGDEAVVELMVIDKFLSLNSAVAEFALKNRTLVKEKGVVSILN